MFITTSRLIAVLRTIDDQVQLPPLTVTAIETPDGVVHVKTRCARTSTGQPISRTMPLLPCADRLCPACAGRVHENEAMWKNLEEIAEVFEYATRRDLPADPFELLRLFRGCGPMFDAVRRYDQAGFPGTVIELGGLLHLLSIRYRQLKEALREPEFVTRAGAFLREQEQVSEDATPVLVGLRRYNPQRDPYPAADLVVAMSWQTMQHGGHFVLHTRDDLATVLARYAGVGGSELAGVTPVGEDDPAVLTELINGLWQPTGSGPMASFDTVVEAARHLNRPASRTDA
jgi:hypothetical protein